MKERMTWKEIIALLRYSTEAETINRNREELAEWFPCIRTMFEYDQNSNYHQYDLWMHSVHTVLGIDKSVEDEMLYLAALFHDIGKPISRCKGKREDDIYAHYYGHPKQSEKIVREEVIPQLSSKGILLTAKEIHRLLYYIKYHDDTVSLKIKSLKRHLQIVDIETFKKLMILEVADAKAHIIYPVIQERIDICMEWLSGRADLLKSEIDGL